MFDKATRSFKRKVDPTGNFISVENISDGLKLAPLTLVIKKKKNLSVKYEIMDYTLFDILDAAIQPSDVKTEDFLIDHSHTSEKGGDAGLSIEAVAGSVSSSTKGKVTDDQSFSDLKKDSVDVLNLIKGYSDRKITDTNKKLLPKLQKGEMLAVVKERIYTSSDVKLSGSREIEAGIMGKMKKVFGLQLGAKYKDSTSYTIPEGTAVVYSLMGVEVEETAIEFSLRPVRPLTRRPKKNSKRSGLGEPSSINTRSVTLTIKPETSDSPSQGAFKTLHQVQEELQEKEAVLQLLAELRPSSRSALIQRLCELLDNREDLTDLEDTLEKWCDGDTFNWPKARSACEILDLLETSSSDPTALLKAAHLLVSMMDALPGPIPSALARCSPDILGGLNTLVNNLKVNGQSPPPDSLPGSLQDGGEFSWAAEILCSTSETLEELKDLWVETGVEPGVFLLALCITVQGLSLLQA